MRIEIFIILLIVVLGYGSGSNSNKKQLKSSHHKHKKSFQQRVAIGHKQYVVKNNSSKSRNSRVINIQNHWEKIPYIFQTYNEPEDDKYYLMPHLSNGFVGTTAKNSSVYLNGLYNGNLGKSHRVRLPSMTAVDAFFPIDTEQEIKTYNFDVRKGAYIVETKTNYALMTQRFFVHRRLKNIIVNEIKIVLLKEIPITFELSNLTNLMLNGYTYSIENVNKYLHFNQENNYENITFEHRVIKAPTFYKEKKVEYNDGIYYLSGKIPDPEVSGKQQKQVFMYYTNIPSKLNVYTNTTTKYFHFIQSIDTESSRAQKAYEEALRMIQQDPTSLYVSHVAAWEDVWTKSGMAMLSEQSYTENNKEAFTLAQRLYSSFYNIYAAIPINFDSQFYGVSPAGLAYGSIRPEYYNISNQVNRQISEAYGGHIMYNQELWILPLVSLFNTDMSKNIIHSRLRRGYNTDSLNMFDQARESAKTENLQGLRYAWEQGDYGVEASPISDAKNKIHTSADISFGLRSYMRTIQGRDFLLQPMAGDVSIKGEDYVLELAKYWFDKLQLDSVTNKYGINGVSFGERSRSREVNNEAFTNHMASETMKTYKYALKLTDKNPYDTQYSYITRDYDDKINRLKLPYDELKQLYLEYDAYSLGDNNEETFVPFLNYPAQKYLTYTQKKAIYDNYANQLPNDGKNIPAYASYLVGYMELNEEQKSKDYLGRIGNHFNEPFHVLSEYPHTGFLNPLNTFNYLPGYAAFAQAFIAAYCGIRFQDFQLDLVYPSEHFDRYSSIVNSAQNNPIFKSPVQNLETWNVTGVNFGGNKLDFLYNLRTKSVEIINRRPIGSISSGEENLEVFVYEGTAVTMKPLRIGESLKIDLNTDAWKYAPNSKKQFRSALYSENLNILASIYSTNKVRHVERMSDSNRIEMKYSILLVLTFLQFIFVSYL